MIAREKSQSMLADPDQRGHARPVGVRLVRALSSYEMACIAAVTGLLLSVAVAVGL